MKYILKLGAAFMIYLMPSGITFSQINSPLSDAPKGIYELRNFGASDAMSAGASAYRTPNVINWLNPASYTSSNLTTIDFGIKGTNLLASINDSTQGSNNLSISHLSFLMPIAAGKGGMAFGINNSGQRGFKYKSISTDATFGRYTAERTGDGNIYNIFAGGAYQIKNLSLGANIRIEFGNQINNSNIRFTDSSFLPISRLIVSQSMFGLGVNLGAQYIIPIDKKSNASVGAYFIQDLSNHISTHSSSYSVTEYSNGQTASRLLGTSSSERSHGLYRQYGLGINYTSQYTTTYGLEFTYRDFSDIKSITNEQTLGQSWDIGTGIEYKPVLDPKANLRKLYNRIIYRLGVNVGKSAYNIPNTINELRLQGNISIPVLTRNISYITLGAQWHQLGFDTKANAESYFKLFVQFSFSDRWFIRSKFD